MPRPILVYERIDRRVKAGCVQFAPRFSAAMLAAQNQIYSMAHISEFGALGFFAPFQPRIENVRFRVAMLIINFELCASRIYTGVRYWVDRNVLGQANSNNPSATNWKP